jgi:hypothetical protein
MEAIYVTEAEQIRIEERVLTDIRDERDRQMDKWGISQMHPCVPDELMKLPESYRGVNLTAHYGLPHEKGFKEVVAKAFSEGKGTYAHIAVEELIEAIASPNVEHRREELVQCAAVIVAWIAKIDLETKLTKQAKEK